MVGQPRAKTVREKLQAKFDVLIKIIAERRARTRYFFPLCQAQCPHSAVGGHGVRERIK